MGNRKLIAVAAWPEYDENKTIDSTVEMAVQICGKLKGTITLPSDVTKENALAAVRADEKFASLIEGKTVVKEIFVPGKIINLVLK